MENDKSTNSYDRQWPGDHLQNPLFKGGEFNLKLSFATYQQGAEQFLAELEQLVFDKIPKQPTAFPEFQKKPTKAKVYRKALCRKKWNVIYKIEPKRILFIYIYHSSRNIDRIKI